MSHTLSHDRAAEQSRRDGTAKTDDGRVVETKGPAVPDNAPDVSENDGKDPNAALSHEEIAALVGELEPGDEGYLLLDNKGFIKGTAKKGKPPEDVPFVPVHRRVDTTPAELATPSGAPITRRMNTGTRTPTKQRA